MEKQNRQTGATQALSPIAALIIGAGPVGLFQAFELGLLGISAQVIDVLPHIGGQCIELYPDKPIYDIPALAQCSGRELIERLQRQIAPFDVAFHLGQKVARVQRADDGSIQVQTDQGLDLYTQTLFIAAGVGAFVPRSWPLAQLKSLRGVQHAADPIPEQPNSHVVIAGGDGHIMDTLRLWRHRPCASLTLVHRRDQFDLEPADQALVDAMVRDQGLRRVIGQPTACQSSQGRLSGLEITPPQGPALQLPCDVLIQCLGLSPSLGPVADWGLAMARRQLLVNARDFGTSEAGIYAVGDINHYPGKRKLIVSGFHEATLAAYGAAERLSGGPVALEYTTASARLQQRLKV